MNKFKVGDRVKRIIVDCDTVKVGVCYTVTGLPTKDMVSLDVFDQKHWYYNEYFELAWQPAPGEMIEVSDSMAVWTTVAFKGEVDGQYVCSLRLEKNSRLYVWKHARPIKKTHTITLEDGTKVELSEESYKALQDSVK